VKAIHGTLAAATALASDQFHRHDVMRVL